MAWLGNSFTQITGQISNFTKEVLTEGTEEIDDPAAALQLAQRRIQELENGALIYKTELERAEVIFKELNEKLEASELQNGTLSSEYRLQLTEKQVELQELRQRQEELVDHNSHLLKSRDNQGQQHIPSQSSGTAYTGEEHDLHDIISAQHEINRLQGEVQRFQSESKHWQQVAQQRDATRQGQSEEQDQTGTSQHQTSVLEQHVQELQKQLADVVDQHQTELSAVQDAYSAKLSDIKRKNKQQQNENKASGNDIKLLQERVQHLESINQKITCDLEQMYAADKEKARQLEDVLEEKEKLEEEVSRRDTENEFLQGQVDDMCMQSQKIRPSTQNGEESQFMEADVSPIKSSAKQLFHSSTPIANRYPKRDDADSERNDEHCRDDILSKEMMSEEIQELVNQVNSYQEEKSQFESIQTDLILEKEALEEVVLKLRNQIKETEEALSATQGLHEQHLSDAQHHDKSSLSRGTPSDIDMSEASKRGNEELNAIIQSKIGELDELNIQTCQQRTVIERLDAELKKCVQEKERLVKEMKENESEIANLRLQAHVECQACLAREDKDEHLTTLQQHNQSMNEQLKVMDSDNQSLTEQLTKAMDDQGALEASLQELDAQHEVAMGQILSSREGLQSEVQQLTEKLSRLTADTSHPVVVSSSGEQEKEDNKSEINAKLDEMGEKLEAAGMSLNNMHMERKELDGTVARLQGEVRGWRDRADKLRAEKRDLQTANRTLQEQVNHSLETHKTNDRQQDDIVKLEAKVNDAISAFNRSKTECEMLQSEILNLQGKSEEQQKQLKEQWALNTSLENRLGETSITKQSTDQINLLEEQNNDLLQQIKAAKGTIEAEKHLVQSTTNEREMLLVKQEELIKALEKEKDKANYLGHEIKSIEAEKMQTIEKLEVALDSNNKLNDRVQNLKSELHLLQEDHSKFQKDDSKRQVDHTKLQEDYSKLQEYHNKLQKEHSKLQEDHSKLHENMMQTEASTQQELYSTNTKQDDKTVNIITELEHEMQALHKTIESQNLKLAESLENTKRSDTTVLQLREEIKKCSAKFMEQEDILVRLREEHSAMEASSASSPKNNVSSLVEQDKPSNRAEMSDKTTESSDVEKLKALDKSGHSNKEDTPYNNHDNKSEESVIIENITNNEEHNNDKMELQQLKKLVAQKDRILLDFKDSNSSLVQLLEERSLAMHGDRTLVDLHEIQQEVRSLRMEKEQMMSVMTEKSRECSQLKSEVHRLMSVVSAEKAALYKLQQDNQEIKSNLSAPHHDMKQEAIKKLSQLIHDKDLEIESLALKNQTLLQVLQESSPDGVQLSTLLQERDNLKHQVAIFQSDREQILVAVNAKHQECVNYHNELVRLGEVMNSEGEQRERLQQQYTTLAQQYENKQQALLKSQHQALNYRQKYQETNTAYRDVLKRQRLGSSTGSPGTNSQSSTPAEESESSLEDLPVAVASLQIAQTEEAEQLKNTVASQQDKLNEREVQINERDKLIREKQQTLLDRDRSLSEKERQLAEYNVRQHRYEEQLSSKDGDLNVAKKQTEQITFQLRSLKVEHDELTQEMTELRDKFDSAQQEIQMTREANNKLALSINDKEFEVTAMKEKISTLTHLWQEREGGAPETESARLIKERETMQDHTQAIKRDRDQFAAALQQQQQENTDLKTEYSRSQDKVRRLMSELERLRHHLLEVEDSTTREALASEEREKELRNKLTQAEERALVSSSAVESANDQAIEQMASLQQQLHTVEDQRDGLRQQLAASQETSQQYATSLTNLQMVLEQFQHEREVTQAAEVERYHHDLEKTRQECRHLQSHSTNLQNQLDETNEALQAAQRLSEQLDRKEEMISALREEVHIRERQLTEAEHNSNRIAAISQAKVDKDMVRSLLLGYFHAPASQRSDVLLVMGRVLNFSQVEIEQLMEDGSDQTSKGWLSGIGGLLRRSPQSAPSTPTKRHPDKSFSELFVKFLERESSPQPTLRLPAEAMAREEQQRHQQHRSKPAFNPFAVPLSTSASELTSPLSHTPDSSASPATLPLSSADSHILMKPIAQPLHVYTPLASNEPIGTALGASATTNSAMSGRSTSSSALLRDVLQQ